MIKFLSETCFVSLTKSFLLIAFFGQGLDAFAEWRRLDYLVLTADPATVLDGKCHYGFSTRIQIVESAQGKDLLTTKLWFDAN